MIKLQKSDNKAIIDVHGAWLTNLSDASGDIVFPKRTFELGSDSVKVRGGCHVCLPNFGPGGESGQVQHGFGREVVWTAENVGENYALLTLNEGPGEYKELSSTLSYILEDSHLEMILELVNNGPNTLRMAPGFHPYFSLRANETDVKIDDKLISLETMSEVDFIKAEAQTLHTAQRRLILTSDNLPVWGRWTDELGPYVCVEPNLDGFAFLKATPRRDELLAPGAGKKYSFVIAWEAA